MDKPAVRVLVVDDHDFIRRSICSLISQDPMLEVICQTADGEEAVKKAAQLQPDLIILDIGLPGISGIEAAPEILKASPNSQIIFLSQHNSVQIAREALKSGGRAYVTKSQAASGLLKAVRLVREGNFFISQEVIDQGWTPDV